MKFKGNSEPLLAFNFGQEKSDTPICSPLCGVMNGSPKLALAGARVACVAEVDDINGINQGTCVLKVMSKQLGEQIENIS